MARMMLAWELGGGLGHAVPLAQIAAELLRRGHEVHLVWRDLSVAHHVLGDLLRLPCCHLWQSPLVPARRGGLPEPATHAEILLAAGYHDADGLSGVVRAWRQLFDAIRPQLLLADHAPTALLASRGANLRRALIGSGFLIPPSTGRLPVFRDWEAVPIGRTAAAESRVLVTCNAVLDRFQAPRLGHLGALFEADETLLLGWPELDHLAEFRKAAPLRSWGALPTAKVGDAPEPPEWPAADGPRLFGYLKPDHPSIEAVLSCLRSGPWCSLVVLQGASSDEADGASGGRLKVVGRPLDMPAAMAGAQLLLSFGGTGAIHAALGAGVPVVMLPVQAEQLLLARRVVKAGAGVLVWPSEVAASLGRCIAAVLSSPGFGIAAAALAARNGEAVHGNVLAAVTARCEALAQAQ